MYLNAQEEINLDGSLSKYAETETLEVLIESHLLLREQSPEPVSPNFNVTSGEGHTVT